MKFIRSVIKSPLFPHVLIGLYLCLYLANGFYTELKLMALKPLPDSLFQDFKIYERALTSILAGKDPYAIRNIGQGFLYPTPALLIIEIFHYIRDFYFRASVFSTVNIALLVLIVYGTARHYGYAAKKIWFWYVLCLGFAPFLELIHIGQINIITLFGIFMLFYWTETSAILSSVGLALAIITKVSPVFFFGYLLANKKYKVIAVTIGVIAIFICLGILRYGLSSVLEYPKTFMWLLNQFHFTLNSQALVSKLAIANTDQFQKAITMLPELLRPSIVSIFTFFTTEYLLVQRILTIYIFLVIGSSCAFTFFSKQPKEPLFIITTLGMMLSPNIAWYHHYVFILLPVLLWMAWSRLDWRVVTWCFLWLLIVQVDRNRLTYGLLIQIISHISLLTVWIWQVKNFMSQLKVKRLEPVP